MELAAPEAEKRSDADSGDKDVGKFVNIDVHLKPPSCADTYIVHVCSLRARAKFRSYSLHISTSFRMALDFFAQVCRLQAS